MRQCMDAENLHRRMKKLMGQLQAIDQMIDKDVPCEDILIQINAVKGALHRVGQIVLEGHLQHCVRDGIEPGDARLFFVPCLTTYTPIGILRADPIHFHPPVPAHIRRRAFRTCRTCGCP